MSLRAAGVESLTHARPSTPLVRFLVVLLAAISLAGSQTARADNAGSVLRKMASLYTSARSYEGTMTIRQSGKAPDGTSSTVSIVQHVRYRTPNRFQANMTISGTGPAAKFAKGGAILTSDGHTLYRYATLQKVYTKMPAPPRLTLMQLLNLPDFDIATAKVTGSSSVNGHSAYEVDAKPALPTLPAKMPAQQKEQMLANMKRQLASMKPIRLAIDKQSGQILRATVSAPMGSRVIDFSSQTFNPSLSTSVFTFKPPAGAKEQPMAMPSGMGAPGPPHGGAPGPLPGGRRP